MNIVDSSLWIEYFIDGKNASKIETIINDSENLKVPTVILAEFFKWILREKDEQSAIQALASMKIGKIIDLTEEIAINAAYYCNKYKLSIVDSFIFSTSQFLNANIYTMDSYFKGLPNVEFYAKN